MYVPKLGKKYVLQLQKLTSHNVQEPDNRDFNGDPGNCVTVAMWDLHTFKGMGMEDRNCDKNWSHGDLVCQKRP